MEQVLQSRTGQTAAGDRGSFQTPEQLLAPAGQERVPQLWADGLRAPGARGPAGARVVWVHMEMPPLELRRGSQPSPWVGPGKPNLPLGLRGKAGGCARVTAGPKRPHLGVCPGPNIPLQGRQGSRGCTPGKEQAAGVWETCLAPGWPQLRSRLPFGPRSQASLQRLRGRGPTHTGEGKTT